MKDRRCSWYTVVAVVVYLLAIAGAVLIANVRPDLLREYGTYAAGLGALASAYFVVGCLRFGDYLSSQEGVHVVVFSSVIGIVLAWVFAARFFTWDPQTLFLIGVCVYVTMFFLMFWRAVIFTRVQLAARREMRLHDAAE